MRLVLRWGVAVAGSAAGFALAWRVCGKLTGLDEGVSLGIAGAVLAVLLAVAASGFVALAMNRLFGRSFVGGAPAGTRFAPAQCQYWLSIWHGAPSCGQAAMLESSSDAVSLRVLGGGAAGVALLGAYVLASLYWRRGGVRVLPRALFPLAAAAAFTAGALVLVVCTFTGGPLGVPAGPGAYLSGAMVAAAAAAGYAARARHLLRPARR